MSKGGMKGGMLSGQPNLSLPTDTYCTTAINHSPFGHQEETDNCPESPKASDKARPRLGCLPPAALSPNLGNLHGP